MKTIVTKKVIEIGGSLYLNIPMDQCKLIDLKIGDIIKAEIEIIKRGDENAN